jgi:hypothetical protein
MITMIALIPKFGRRLCAPAMAALAALTLSVPGAAQNVETLDPDAAFNQQGAIDGDLSSPPAQTEAQTETQPAPAPAPSPAAANDPGFATTFGDYAAPPATDVAPLPADGAAAPAAETIPAATSDTYAEDDLIGAAEGAFGKGAEGLAKLIEDLLKKQGEPNGYIVGREAGGAFIVGARYGSGTLHHKVEGTQPVYWTGPSIGFDVGANAANTFVLVYNLYDTEDLFKRYAAGEGQAYFVGGLNASYLRRGDVVLIPIRVGAGLRLGVNAGYMKFSKEQKWSPF